MRVDQLGALMPDEAGTVVYGVDGDTNELVRVDLATGEMFRRSVRGGRGDPVNDDVDVIARQGGAVVTGTWGASFVADGPAGLNRRSVRIPRPVGGQLIAATAPDQLWSVTVDGGRSMRAQRVDTSGNELGEPVDLPDNTFLLGDDGTGGLLLAAPGGRYRVSDTGPPSRVADTLTVAWSADTLVQLSCDPGLHCELVSVDRRSGARRVLGPAPSNAVNLGYTGVSPDGKWIARPVDDGIEVTNLLDGSSTVQPSTLYSAWGSNGAPATMAWSASGRHLLWLDDDGRLMSWTVGTSEVVVVGGGLVPPLRALSVAPAGR